MCSFVFKRSGDHRNLHSCRTGRSPDLGRRRTSSRSRRPGRRGARAPWDGARSGKIGRAHVCTPVTLIYLVCALLFLNDPATTEIYTLAVQDALPTSDEDVRPRDLAARAGEERELLGMERDPV